MFGALGSTNNCFDHLTFGLTVSIFGLTDICPFQYGVPSGKFPTIGEPSRSTLAVANIVKFTLEDG